MFEVTAQLPQKRVVTVFTGAFDDNEQEFEEAFRNAVRDVSPNGESFDLLSDFSQAESIPSERDASAEELIGWAVQKGLRRSANVVGKVFQKMQIKRLSARHDSFRYFETREDADGWLSE